MRTRTRKRYLSLKVIARRRARRADKREELAALVAANLAELFGWVE